MSPTTKVATLSALLSSAAFPPVLLASDGALARDPLVVELRLARLEIPTQPQVEPREPVERQDPVERDGTNYRGKAEELSRPKGGRESNDGGSEAPIIRRNGGGSLINRIRGLGAATQPTPTPTPSPGVRAPVAVAPPPASAPPPERPAIATTGTQPGSVATPAPAETGTPVAIDPGNGPAIVTPPATTVAPGWVQVPIAPTGVPLLWWLLGSTILAGLGGLMLGSGGGKRKRPAGGGIAGLGIERVAVQPVQACDCSSYRRNLREAEKRVAETEKEIADAKARMAKAKAALDSWTAHEKKCVDWLAAYKDFKPKIDAAIDSWIKYIAFLTSLMGPMAIAGKHQFSCYPQDGWIEVAPGLWANSEEAAQAAIAAAQAAEALAGSLMSTASGGLVYVGALAIAQMNLAQAQAAAAAAAATEVAVKKDLAKAKIVIPQLRMEITTCEEIIAAQEKHLVTNRQKRDEAAAALKACLEAKPPQCPPGAPVVERLDVAMVEGNEIEPPPGSQSGLPEAPPEAPPPPPPDPATGLPSPAAVTAGLKTATKPKPAEPPQPPSKEPPPRTREQLPPEAHPTFDTLERKKAEVDEINRRRAAGETISRADEVRWSTLSQDVYDLEQELKRYPTVTAPTAAAPTGPSVLLDETQQREVQTKVAERAKLRSEIRELEAKPDKTPEDNTELTRLRQREAEMTATIHNTVVRFHNANVERVQSEYRKQETLREVRERTVLRPEDMKRVEELTRERETLVNKPDPTETDRTRIAELDREIESAQKTALDNARTKVVVPPPESFDAADRQRLTQVDTARSTVSESIAQLEDKQAEGTLTALDVAMLASLRAELAALNAAHSAALKTAIDNASTRLREEKAAEAKRMEEMRSKVPQLDPVDRERIESKTAGLETIEREYVTALLATKEGERTAAQSAEIERLRSRYVEAYKDLESDIRESFQRAPAWRDAEATRRAAAPDAAQPSTRERYASALAGQPPPPPPPPPPSAPPPPSLGEAEAAATKLRDQIATWAREKLRLLEPTHPLLQLLLAIGANIGPESMGSILAGVKATDPRNALTEIALAADAKLPSQGSLTLLESVAGLIASAELSQIRRIWGSAPVDHATRTRLYDRISELAIASDSLPSLTNALAWQTSVNAQRGALATQIKARIHEVFAKNFDTDAIIKAFETSKAPFTERASQLANVIARLSTLAEQTGSQAVTAALGKLTDLASRVAKSMESEIGKAVGATQDAGAELERNLRLIEKVKSTGTADLTDAEKALFTRLLPGWETLAKEWAWFWQRTGETAARKLVPALEEYHRTLERAMQRSASRVASLDRTRMQLLTGHLNASARRQALHSAFTEARDAADAFEKSMADSSITGLGIGQLAAMRARTESRQAMAFAGDTEAIQRELDRIRLELNGWDEDVERPGYILTTRVRHKGLREKLHELDPKMEHLESEVATLGADADETMRRARLTRERIGYLQQRRVNLMLADAERFTFGSLQSELRRDELYWQSRQPWKELEWISGDKVSGPVWQQTQAARLHELPVLAWQMASAQNDPQSFMSFLLTLQDEKMSRGERAWEEYQDTPWYRRGAATQSYRLSTASSIINEMLEKDQSLRMALVAGASVPVDKLPSEQRAKLRELGFITRDAKGVERYSIPATFQWDAFGVLDRASQLSTWDHILNLPNVAHLAATYVVGGWAGQIAKGFALSEAAYGTWIAFGSQVAIESTVFLAADNFMRGGNIFKLLVGNVSASELGKEWLHTALTLGVLHGFHGLREAHLENLMKTNRAAYEALVAQRRTFLGGSREAAQVVAAELALMTGIGAAFDGVQAFSPENLARTAFMLGVMRTTGAITQPAAARALAEATRQNHLQRLAHQNYQTKVREVFERARSEGRRELNDHERAVLDASREQLTASTGKLDLTESFRDVEASLGKELGVAIGEARGAWRDVARSETSQREMFDGKTLLEALRTLDGKAGDPFEVRYHTALKAAARFMYEAGSWVGTKQEMYRDHPEIAEALFTVRKAWAEWIKSNYSASVIGTVNDMRNDCDFNFSLGTGDAFNPVPRMLAAKSWTRDLVRRLLTEAGIPAERANTADHEILFETNSYTDPGIIHFYTQLPRELQTEVIKTLTRDSIGLAEYWVKHHLGSLPPEITERAMRGLTAAGRDANVRTPDQVARDLGITNWDSAAGVQALYEAQSQRFADYAKDPTNTKAVLEICEIQMLINSRAEGAYITPGAALVTVSIKEGRLSRDMVELKGLIEGLKTGERTADTEARIKALEEALEYARLEKIKELTVDEALQSVIGDMVFFWHIAEAASRSAQAFDVVMRYEFSKYVARLLEVARVHGMDPRSGVAGDYKYLGIAKLLKIATRIYKGKMPGEVMSGERPALAGITEMRSYMEAVQRASNDVIRYLLERSSLNRKIDAREGEILPGDGDPTKTEAWLEPTEAGWNGHDPSAVNANLQLVRMLYAERAIRDARDGKTYGAPNADSVIERAQRDYTEALTKIDEALKREGEAFWDHFDPQDATMLRKRLEEWRRSHMYDEVERPIRPGELVPSIQTGPTCAPTSIADALRAFGLDVTANDVIDAGRRAASRNPKLTPPDARGWMTRETRKAAIEELGFEAQDASFRTIEDLKALTDQGQVVVSVYTIRGGELGGGAHAMRVVSVDPTAKTDLSVGTVTLADTNRSRLPGQESGGRIIDKLYAEFFQHTRPGDAPGTGYALVIRRLPGGGLASEAGRLALVNLAKLQTAETGLAEARVGKGQGGMSAPVRVAVNFRQYMDAITALRDGLRAEGPAFWRHFDAKDAALLRERLDGWTREGRALPPLGMLVQQAIAASRPAPAPRRPRDPLEQGGDDWQVPRERDPLEQGRDDWQLPRGAERDPLAEGRDDWGLRPEDGRGGR